MGLKWQKLPEGNVGLGVSSLQQALVSNDCLPRCGLAGPGLSAPQLEYCLANCRSLQTSANDRLSQCHRVEPQGTDHIWGVPKPQASKGDTVPSEQRAPGRPPGPSFLPSVFGVPPPAHPRSSHPSLLADPRAEHMSRGSGAQNRSLGARLEDLRTHSPVPALGGHRPTVLRHLCPRC